MRSTAAPPLLQIRVKLSPTKAFGPGKADLLERIASSGSISAAARAMKMSYKRAWQLVDDMNASFRSALVKTAAGGSQGGGATLTGTGKTVLASYRSVQRSARAAARRELATLTRLAQVRKCDRRASL
jgi:molybdate transport system regulatory protein